MITRFSRKWKITQKDIEAFALVVGDANPVHRDPEFAAKTRFKTPIAHGMTALCILNHALPKKYVLSSFNVKFLRPIYPGY